IKRILDYIYAQPFPYRWMHEMTELYNPKIPFESSVWYDYAVGEINYLLDYALSLAEVDNDIAANKLNYIKSESEVKMSELTESDIIEIKLFKQALDNSFFELSQKKPAFGRLSTKNIEESPFINVIKSNRETIKKILRKDIPSFFTDSPEDYAESTRYIYRIVSKLAEVVTAVDERLTQEKKNRNAFSFSDTEHFAIDLLFSENDGEIVRTPLAENLSNGFYEILVDEYQDTNEVQDLLFRYLSNGRNLFVVGDVKQSIYRFRQAMPDIFNRKRKEYPYYNADDNSPSSKIILDKNFRSRKEICSYVNFVFSFIMSERVGEMEYGKDEYLNYSASYEDTDVPSAQLKILNTADTENPIEAEAVYIAKTIDLKVKSGELIKDGDSYRPVRYGDFAILMRSLKGKIQIYSDTLSAYGIPVICDNSSDLFDSSEIKLIMSLIRAIDNPTLDISLLAVMQSPIYSFTPDELSELRINNRRSSFYMCVRESENKKAIDFLEDLSRLRRLSVTMSVAGFIRYLTEEKGIIPLVNAMGNGEQRSQNILKLISFADNFDKGDNVGLTSFVRYIDKINDSSSRVDAASLSAIGENAVTIMSVHRSKGLEFPICIFARASVKYNNMDLREKLLLNTHYGFAVKCHNEEDFYQYSSVAYQVVKDKNTYELMSENLRVLYVALTRAKEQFITFIRCDNIENKINALAPCICSGGIDPYVCRRISNDGDLLLLCALFHKDGEVLRNMAGLTFINQLDSDFDMDIQIEDGMDVLNSEQSFDFIDADNDIVAAVDKKLSYECERINLSQMSLKLTASTLDDDDNNFEFITSSKPAFMCKDSLTPAQRGTAMHSFMQYCDYELARKNLETEIARLADNGFINAMQADSLDRKRLSNFFKSDFADQMFNSDKIYREICISSFVGANEIYDTDYDDKVLIQGIADCVFEENGSLVLVDYKTDRVDNEAQLLGRYEKQISFYRYSLEKTLQKPVKEAVLYSFCLEQPCLYK
ncbi:MAG: UvrD-helicase domain-containing protein, partial [Clostridiales bacterium]|nr:UvrD-helicase domain-containing protein [Clostridiales bacterium]